MSAVNLAKAFYQRLRNAEAFSVLYDAVVKSTSDLNVSAPMLPTWRYRRAPARIDSGSQPHRFETSCDYHCSFYWEACDLLLKELEERFQQKDLLPSALAMESLLLSVANGETFTCTEDPKKLEKSRYKSDFDFSSLNTQLLLLADVIKTATPSVRNVTNICTIANAMNSQETCESLLSEVHKLI